MNKNRLIFLLLMIFNLIFLSSLTFSVNGLVQKKIKMTSGNISIIIKLNDSQASKDLLKLLPLEMNLIERNEFAKGMRLPKELSSNEEKTRDYVIGGFGYWPAGPDLAIFYSNIHEKTIVEVIILGKAESGAEAFAKAEGKVRLELIVD